MDIADRIQSLGFVLPECPAPTNQFIPVKKYNDVFFLSGQIGIENGTLICEGKVGESVSIEDAGKSAEIAVLRLLAQLRCEVELEKVKIIKLNGYVASSEDFHDQPKVIDYASQLLEKIFGVDGKHARTAIGVNSLPRNASVEIELIAGMK